MNTTARIDTAVKVLTATPEQYDELLQLIDTPIETTKLAALLREESPFGKTIEATQ